MIGSRPRPQGNAYVLLFVLLHSLCPYVFNYQLGLSVHYLAYCLPIFSDFNQPQIECLIIWKAVLTTFEFPVLHVSGDRPTAV